MIDRVRLKELYDQNVTYQRIADKMKVSRQRVEQVAREMGLPKRGPRKAVLYITPEQIEARKERARQYSRNWYRIKKLQKDLLSPKIKSRSQNKPKL